MGHSCPACGGTRIYESEHQAVALCKTEAIVLRTYDFRETSQIAVFYSRDFGKLRILAKGSKRPKGPTQGPLDLLALCEVVFYEPVRSQLGVLRSAAVLESFPALRRELARQYLGLRVAEILDRFTDEEDPSRGLFDAARTALRAIAGGADPELSCLVFEAAALKLTGFGLLAERCVACGDRVAGDIRVRFSEKLRGWLCPGCWSQDPQGWSAPLRLLEECQRWGEAGAKDPGQLRPVSLKSLERSELRRILNAYEESVVGRTMETSRFLAKTNRQDAKDAKG